MSLKPNFKYTQRNLELESGDICYWDEGDGQQCILLIHGVGCSKEYWAWIVPQLEQDYRVVAFDLPGYGASAVPVGSFTSLKATTRFLNQFMEALKIRNPIIVGQSLGAGIAVQYGISNPSDLRGLVIISPMGFGKEIDFLSKVFIIPGIGELLFRPSPNLIRDFLQGNFEIDGIDDLVDITHEYFRKESVIKWHLSLMRSGINLFGQKIAFTAKDLSQIRVPTLILHGKQDPLFPIEHAQRAAELIPNAELHLLERVKHNPHIERPDLVTELISQFIQKKLQLG